MWIILLYLIGGVVLGSLAYAAISLAPRAPTRSADIEQIHEVADLHDWQLFVEIGCGHSAVSRWIAKRNSGVHVLWIELAFPLYLYSYLFQKVRWLNNLTIMYGDALKYNFVDADVLYVFWLPNTVNAHLKDKAEQEMKSWAKLISYQFWLESWTWGQVQTIKLEKGLWNLFVYTKK
jgi:hypothetical protein